MCGIIPANGAEQRGRKWSALLDDDLRGLLLGAQGPDQGDDPTKECPSSQHIQRNNGSCISLVSAKDRWQKVKGNEQND